MVLFAALSTLSLSLSLSLVALVRPGHSGGSVLALLSIHHASNSSGRVFPRLAVGCAYSSTTPYYLKGMLKRGKGKAEAAIGGLDADLDVSAPSVDASGV